MIILEKHKKGLKIIMLCYIVFAGCFSFPIHSKQFSINFIRVYLFIAEYGIIGGLFAGIYGKGKGKLVYLLTSVLTALGMTARFLLEFGEVSNTYNFTWANILSYLVIIPVAVLAIYLLSVKTTENKEKSADE